MDYTENDEREGVTKWPFYLAALFIITLVIGFAYLHLKVNETLDQWQLITCILASGLGSILVFIPHLIDRFLAIAFDPSNREDEELHRKTYFDIKEMKSELEAFSVKVDKVPTLVDKIVSDALKKDPSVESDINRVSNDIDKIKNTLIEKIKNLEELIVQGPLLPETDPALSEVTKSIPNLQKSIDAISIEIKDIQKTVSKIPTKFPKSIVNEEEVYSSLEVENIRQQDQSLEDNKTPSSEEENVPTEEEVLGEVIEKQENRFDEPSKELSETSETIQDLAEDSIDDDLDSIEEGDVAELIADGGAVEEKLESKNKLLVNEESNLDEKSAELPEEGDNLEEKEVEELIIEDESYNKELDLDLPDPLETIRKVDAILQETDPDHSPSPLTIQEEPIKPKTSQTGTTSVVANVMIGIGNKPYLRGEGPGLNWDEGVPMNFIEIGKWAWSPPRKNASLTVQLYRNDNDPDKSGKIEVKAGDKIEINPDFS
jgi:hypothetical protein